MGNARILRLKHCSLRSLQKPAALLPSGLSPQEEDKHLLGGGGRCKDRHHERQEGDSACVHPVASKTALTTFAAVFILNLTAGVAGCHNPVGT